MKIMLVRRCFVIILLLIFALGQGCHPPPKRIGFYPLTPSKARAVVKKLDISLQGISSWEALNSTLSSTLKYLQGIREKKLILINLSVSVDRLKRTLKEMLGLLPRLNKNPALLADKFIWYQLLPTCLFTGYFEMDIPASLSPSDVYKYPIYGVPSDLKKVYLGKFHPRWRGQYLIYRIEGDHICPYYSRKQIDGDGAIRTLAPIIAWAKDPVDIFFLQIQGSGRLILPDGSYRYIGYAGKNGRQYVSIGKYLIKKGYISKKDATLDGIMTYLKKHPELVPKVLYKNPSYVFFRLLKDGPYGAMGVKLTPLVSLATDRRVIPLGSLLIFNVNIPTEAHTSRNITGFGISQDVGGAIVGSHVDLFCGQGKDARFMAGHLSNYGRIYLILAKEK